MKINSIKSVTSLVRSFHARLALVVLACVLIATQTGVDAKQPVRRIKFKPGTTSARVMGKLSGMNDKAVFLIRVNAGQHLVAEVQSKHSARVSLVSPSGQSGDQDMQGTHTGVDSTEAGDYRITVTENPKADPWKGTFYLNVTVL
ncbi:MAG TPA: hypothetical protein VF708_07505 [Pyrinomonadaceae bacterium]|jgi:hypothetical protein